MSIVINYVDLLCLFVSEEKSQIIEHVLWAMAFFFWIFNAGTTNFFTTDKKKATHDKTT